MKSRRPRWSRPSPFDSLEARAVPSTTAQAHLAQADAGLGSAYAQFATEARQAELTLLSTGDLASSGTTATVAAQVAGDAATLRTEVAAATSALPAGPRGLILGPLSASSPGGLLSGLADDLAAGSAGNPSGRVPSATLPLLFSAVDGAIAASFEATTVEVELAAASRDPSGPNLNLGRYEAGVDASYAGFAANVRQAEAQLVSPGGPTASADVSAAIGAKVATLAGAPGTLEAGTSSASKAALIRASIAGPEPGNLGSELTGLVAASTAESPGGSVPETSLPLLITAVDAAIDASLGASAVDGSLLASEPSPPPSYHGGEVTGTFDSYGVYFAR